MSDATELDAAKHLIEQLFEGLERLQRGNRTTREGLEQFATVLRTIAGGGDDAAAIVDAAIAQLRLDDEHMESMRELVRRYGLAPDQGSG